MASLLTLESVDFSYPTRTILKNVSFQLGEAQCAWIKGANGTGKTTLLKIISGLLKSEAGRITTASKPSLYLGDLFFYEKMSLLENLNFYRQLQNTNSDFFDELSYCLDLHSFWQRPFEKLSRGERARGALVRALMFKTPLILLDEPFANLDETGRDLLKQLIKNCRENGSSFVIVSHLDLGMSDWIDRNYILKAASLMPVNHEDLLS